MESIDSKADGDFFAQTKLKIDVCQDALQRLQDMDVVESRSADFYQKLCSHFNKLPFSYAMFVKSDGFREVLKHIKLLDLAKTPANCPAINVGQVRPCDPYWPWETLHEITCATNTDPKFLSHFTNVLYSMDLTIKRLVLFTTTDDYSLLVFVVSGIPQRLEKPDQLRKALQKKFLKANKFCSQDYCFDKGQWSKGRNEERWHICTNILCMLAVSITLFSIAKFM